MGGVIIWYIIMATLTIPATYAPEFSLIEVTNPEGAKYGEITVPTGTVLGRLYFNNVQAFKGTFKGKVIYDSRHNQKKEGNERFEIIFIASFEQYRELYKVCYRSNLTYNRIKTVELLNNLK